LIEVGIRWRTLANVVFAEHIQHAENRPTFRNTRW